MIVIKRKHKGISLLEELKFFARSKYVMYNKDYDICDDEANDLL